MEKPKSRFERVVCLRNWWLGKSSEGNQIVVAGFTNREKEARRVFTSAPILKRHDDFNLETVDGISVRLYGFIDKPRTLANGFLSQIFEHFLFGFPAWWVECAKKCLDNHSSTGLLTRDNTGIEGASPQGGGTIEHETADEDIVPQMVDKPLHSSNADKDQNLSGEIFGRNHSSASNVEKQDAIQGETTAEPNANKRMKIDLASPEMYSREAEKKSAHVNESTPVHDTVPEVSPEAASFGRWQSEHQTADEDIVLGDLDSLNFDKHQYLGGETVQRNYISEEDIERQDSNQAKTTKLQKRMKKSAQATRNSRSVKNDLTSARKRKRSASGDVNLSNRKAEKKSPHVNESTPVHDAVPMVSPETSSFRRSRSGRLLLPALEFWTNQRAVYDKDRKIIGVEGILDH